MKKKAKVTRMKRTQTVRLEVVASGTNGGAIVPAQQAQIAPPVSDNAEVALEIARRQMYYRQQLLKLIAAQVNKSDVYVYEKAVTCKKCHGPAKPSFSGDGYYCRKDGQIGRAVDEDLEPYLSGAACRFVLQSAGVKFEDTEMRESRYESTEGPYIDFEVWVTVTPRSGNPVRTMGNNATNDDFFAKRTRYVCPNCSAPLGYGEKCPTHGAVKAKKERYYLSLQEVDVPGVKQKAMTNAWNHAVRDLGLMPTAQHFRDANVDISTCKRISFGRSSDEDVEEIRQPPPPSEERKANKPEPEGKGLAEGNSARGTSPSGTGDKANGGSAGQAAGATKQESKGSTPKNPVPRAEIPPWGGKAKLLDLVEERLTRPNGQGKGGGTPYLRIVQDGKELFLFDNKKLPDDGGTWFGLIQNAFAGKLPCEFRVDESGKYSTIKALVRVGEMEWDDDGIPVLRRDPPSQREPGDDDAD